MIEFVDPETHVPLVEEQGVLFEAATAYLDVWRDQSILQLNINKTTNRCPSMASSPIPRNQYHCGKDCDGRLPHARPQHPAVNHRR